MTASPPTMSFQFDGYTLRPVNDRDRALIASFIAREPSHQGRVTPDFYFAGAGYALEDRHGYVVLYMRIDMAWTARVHMDFAEADTREERGRIGAAIRRGCEWLVDRLSTNGVQEIVFDSEAPLLRLFATHRLGFQATPNDLRRVIARRLQDQPPTGDWPGEPQPTEGVAV